MLTVDERLNKLLGIVKEFRTSSGQEPSALRAITIATEEAVELIDAADALIHNRSVETMENFLKEAADLIYVLAGLVETSEALGGDKAFE